MKVNVNYKGKSVELDIPDEKLEELVKEQKKTGWEKPDMHCAYWWTDFDGATAYSVAHDTQVDEELYKIGNCFTSKELAENIARYQSLDLRIRRRIAEICEPVGWNDPDVHKYTIFYSHRAKNLYVSSYLYHQYSIYNQYSSWYCDTQEHAEQIIEEFKDELIWYFTEFKDRMDG